jgi:hypothetical protein
VSRMVNQTILAPGIVAAMIEETLPPEVALFDLAVDPPRCGRSGEFDTTSVGNEHVVVRAGGVVRLSHVYRDRTSECADGPRDASPRSLGSSGRLAWGRYGPHGA